MKTLLQGKPYVKSCETDIRKTFAKERKRLKEEADKRLNKIFNLPAIKRA